MRTYETSTSLSAARGGRGRRRQCSGRFTRDASYWRFDNHLHYVTTAQTYTIYTVTLYVVNGGNAPTTQIDPSDFPAP